MKEELKIFAPTMIIYSLTMLGLSIYCYYKLHFSLLALTGIGLSVPILIWSIRLLYMSRKIKDNKKDEKEKLS